MVLLSFCFLALPVQSDTCASLSTSGINITYSGNTFYDVENSKYWSTGCADLKPSCILFPDSAEQVLDIIQVLLQNNETFAIKSGGHNPNRGYASIQGGPLISTRGLNEVTYDEASSTVRVGPGNRWEDVSAALDGTGVAVVGGRIGNVGVGGYILGGT